MGNGNFAMVVTRLIAALVYVFFCIMVASLHIMEQVEQMNRQLDGAKCILRRAHGSEGLVLVIYVQIIIYVQLSNAINQINQ